MKFARLVLLLIALLLAVELSLSRDRLHVPVRGLMGHAFGVPVSYQTCGFHTGQDWFAPSGSTLYAIADGTVVHVGPMWMQGEGVGRGDRAIIIDHGGWYTSYGHNRSVRVAVGDAVQRGQAIGEVGSEGFAGGPHLHFEMVIAPFTGDWQEPFEGCDAYVDPGDVWGWF